MTSGGCPVFGRLGPYHSCLVVGEFLNLTIPFKGVYLLESPASAQQSPSKLKAKGRQAQIRGQKPVTTTVDSKKLD